MVGVVNDHIAPSQHRLNITLAGFIVGAEVAVLVSSDAGNKGFPVILRVHKSRVIERCVEIQHRGQNFIFHLNQLHRLIDACFVFARKDRNNIPGKADMTVDHKAVVRAHFGVGLARLGVAAGVLVHIFPGVNHLHAGHKHGAGGINIFDDRIGVGGAQQLDDETVLRDNIIHVHRLAGYKLHGVLLAHRLVHSFHWAASFDFFHAKKFWIPRS